MSQAGLHTSGPSTGVPDLDEALDGLYWGDNVVWQSDGDASPFVDAIVGEAATYDYAAHVRLGDSAVAGLEEIDATAGGPLDRPAPLLDAVRRACRPDRRNLLVFDPLDTMADRWGIDGARRFFVNCCPMLLEVGAIAYWSLSQGERLEPVRRAVEDVTQCIVVVRDGRLRIAKAEGRPVGVQGSVYRCRVGDDGRPALERAPAAARLGTALRAVRLQRGLSQGDLARLAGVSASAISQAERAERGLSLSTLVHLSAALGLTVDDLLHGEDPPTYRIGRRVGDPRRGPERAITLLGGHASGVHVDLVHLNPREAGGPIERQDGEGIVAVSQGLVQVNVGDQTPAIRDGEVLLADCSRIDGWRNLGEREAVLFWIVTAAR